MSAQAEPPRRAPAVSAAGWLCAIGLVSAGLAFGPQVAAQPAADADAGREVYEGNCAMCHGADATGMGGMHPALRGAVQRLTVEGVEVTVRNGRQTTPPMPAFGGRLSDEEIADVIAYLDTLPPGPRNFGPEMDGGGRMGGGGMMDRMVGAGWVGPLVAVALFLLLAAVVVVAVVMVLNRRGVQPRGGNATGGESPREILDRRYAAGELSAEEYRQARDDLDA